VLKRKKKQCTELEIVHVVIFANVLLQIETNNLEMRRSVSFISLFSGFD